MKSNNIVSKLKNKALSRKGTGIELALLVLLVVFGCSILLVSSAVYGQNALIQKERETLEHIKVAQVAEEILNAKDDESFVEAAKDKYSDAYDIRLESNENIISLEIYQKSGDLLLSVTIDNDTVTKWSYH